MGAPLCRAYETCPPLVRFSCLGSVGPAEWDSRTGTRGISRSMERPLRQPFTATYVVKASRALSAGEKLVWLELHQLDRGPDGCWLTPAQLGERLGLSAATVESYRARLSHLGLACCVKRPDAVNRFGWIALLPTSCAPHTARIAGPQAQQLAHVLDGFIRERDPDRTVKLGGPESTPAVDPSQPVRRAMSPTAFDLGSQEPPLTALEGRQRGTAVGEATADGVRSRERKSSEPETLGNILRRLAK